MRANVTALGPHVAVPLLGRRFSDRVSLLKAATV